MLECIPVALFVGTILGFLAGLGIGGGSLLILWLTMALDMDAGTARGINLLFFLPAAAVSIRLQRKQGGFDLKKVFPAMVSGCLAAYAFSWLGSGMDMQLLKKLFGGLLILTGLREITYRPRNAR